MNILKAVLLVLAVFFAGGYENGGGTLSAIGVVGCSVGFILLSFFTKEKEKTEPICGYRIYYRGRE